MIRARHPTRHVEELPGSDIRQQAAAPPKSRRHHAGQWSGRRTVTPTKKASEDAFFAESVPDQTPLGKS